jgi:hypothetical protein
MARDLPGWYTGRPSSVDTYLGLRAAHRATAGRSSQVARAVLARIPGSVDALGRSALPPADPASETAVSELRRFGITRLPPVLEDEEIAALVEFARTAPGRVQHADGTTGLATWHSRPADAAALSIDGAFGWARPEVQELMAHRAVHDLVARSVGMRPVVHPPQLYWTFPVPTQDRTDRALARRFHWDYDGVAGLRLHLYLTDVDDGAGPMEYVAGSHRPGVLGWQRPAIDQVIEDDRAAAFGHVERISGPAGTAFLTNPHGLHRATAPLATERLFLVLPLQAGGYGGYYRRTRALPVRNAELDRRLRRGDPALRLFEAAPASATAAALVTR